MRKNEYSRQIILVGKGQQKAAEPLVKRWTQEHPNTPCHVIEYDPSFPLRSEHYAELANLDAHSKLTIIGHSDGESDFIYGNNSPNSRMHYEDFAALLSEQVHPGDTMDGKQRLTVSLIACYGAGRPDTKPEDSLANHLHLALRQKGFRTNLYGRRAIVITEKDGSKSTVIKGHESAYAKSSAAFENKTQETMSMVHAYEHSNGAEKADYKEDIEQGIEDMSSLLQETKKHTAHHQRGSKLLFTWDTEGNQKQFEAYIFKKYQHHRFFQEALDPL